MISVLGIFRTVHLDFKFNQTIPTEACLLSHVIVVYCIATLVATNYCCDPQQLKEVQF